MYQYIKSAFQKYDAEKIILFGSWARGEGDRYSDVDLIVVVRTNKRFLDRLAGFYEAWSIPVPVDILVYTPEEFAEMVDEENPLIMKAIREGVVMYEKSTH